jgi:uncharacterized protein YcaQ
VTTIRQIRRQTLQASLFAPAKLGRVVATLGFVQADPIRAPARAQDLILRHRVEAYRNGDLDRGFKRLRLEEDFLYAYGFMPRDTFRLLHPRHDVASHDGRHLPEGLAAEVLDFVRSRKTTHPRDLAERFGAERAINGWGGFSKATTRALQSLHYYGLLRVARRHDGIRIYEAAAPPEATLTAAERTRRIVLLVCRILAPISQPSLRATCTLLTRGAPGLGRLADAVRVLLASGELASAEVDGEQYLWPADAIAEPYSLRRQVRFLAPFDPIVWDRRRFEHLWGWAYRFEAYTPEAKRQFGYYAMPMLWGEQVIGWVNISGANGAMHLTPGFIGTAPKGRDFRRAFDAEAARMETFLKPNA